MACTATHATTESLIESLRTSTNPDIRFTAVRHLLRRGVPLPPDLQGARFAYANARTRCITVQRMKIRSERERTLDEEEDQKGIESLLQLEEIIAKLNLEVAHLKQSLESLSTTLTDPEHRSTPYTEVT